MARDRTQNSEILHRIPRRLPVFWLGYTTTVTLGHTKEIDLIVAHPDGWTVTIDVKGLKNKTNWPLAPKLISKNHFYVLVTYLNKFENVSSDPEVFVIPSTRVKSLLSRWSGRPDITAVAYSRVRGSKHKDAWSVLFG